MKSYSNTYNKSFAGEILVMEPWEWLVAVALGLLILLLTNLGFMEPIVAVMERMSLGLRTELYQTNLQAHEIYEGIGNIKGLTAENKSLQQQNEALQAKLAEVEVVFAENQQLINETGVNYDREYKSTGVKVVNRDTNQLGIIVVNKGERDGIRVNDIAVQERILLGRVTEVSPFTAKVRLLVHPQSQLPVKTSRGSLGILLGQSGRQLQTEQILQSTEVVEKDKVFSSGLNGNFPPDLYIGEVESITADSRASTKTAVVESPINWRELAAFKILSLPTE